MSPDAAHAIGIEQHFVAYDRHIFRLGLGYKHAIEGIFMSTREANRRELRVPPKLAIFEISRVRCGR